MGKFDKNSAKGRSFAPKAKSNAPRTDTSLRGNSEMDRVAAFLASVKFKKRVFGGLDPADVWKKIDELNSLYENAIVAERARYDLLLRLRDREVEPEESYLDGEFHG